MAGAVAAISDDFVNVMTEPLPSRVSLPFEIEHGTEPFSSATVAVPWGVFALDDMRAENPTYEIESFDELVSMCTGR